MENITNNITDVLGTAVANVTDVGNISAVDGGFFGNLTAKYESISMVVRFVSSSVEATKDFFCDFIQFAKSHPVGIGVLLASVVLAMGVMYVVSFKKISALKDTAAANNLEIVRLTGEVNVKNEQLIASRSTIERQRNDIEDLRATTIAQSDEINRLFNDGERIRNVVREAIVPSAPRNSHMSSAAGVQAIARHDD
jgi:hypothetical protein